MSIKAPVGKNVPPNKGNFSQDVFVVQAQLNLWITFGKLDRWVKLLVPDGKCGNKTIEAIEFFQQTYLGFHDGRIDVNGKTANLIFGPMKPRPDLIPSQKAELPSVTNLAPVALDETGVLKLVFINKPITLPGPHVEVYPGNIYQSSDGVRLIITGDGTDSIHSEVVYIQTSVLPEQKSAKLGLVYRQNKIGFQNDVFYAGRRAAEVTKHTEGLRPLIEIEMYFMLGFLTAIGGAPATLFHAGTKIGSFTAKYKNKFPKWINLITVALSVRSTLKVFAPTFYDKLINNVLLGAFKTLKGVVIVYGTDIASNLPEAMIKDKSKIAKLLGQLIGKIGNKGLETCITITGAILKILLGVIMLSLKSIPVSAKMEADKIIKKFREAGAYISQAEGETIIFEFVKHGSRIKPEIEKLIAAVNACS